MKKKKERKKENKLEFGLLIYVSDKEHRNKNKRNSNTDCLNNLRRIALVNVLLIKNKSQQQRITMSLLVNLYQPIVRLARKPYLKE